MRRGAAVDEGSESPHARAHNGNRLRAEIEAVHIQSGPALNECATRRSAKHTRRASAQRACTDGDDTTVAAGSVRQHQRAVAGLSEGTTAADQT